MDSDFKWFAIMFVGVMFSVAVASAASDWATAYKERPVICEVRDGTQAERNQSPTPGN